MVLGSNFRWTRGGRDRRASGFVVVSAVAIGLAAAPSGQAQTGSGERIQLAQATIQFDIPPQDLDSALTRLADQAGIRLLFASGQLGERRTGGLSGRYSVGEALTTLLAGTGLTWRYSETGAVVLDRITQGGDAAPVVLDAVRVAGSTTPPQATIGAPPPAYAGGQVARGSRLGLLGNRDVFDVPFNVTSYTAKTIEDQQAHTIGDVVINDPSFRNSYPRGANTDEFMIRGFTLYNREVAFDGLYGLLPFSTVSLEGVERVEVLKGPNAMLSGMAHNGSIGGGINIVPKRAGDEPVTRLTTSYSSESQLGAHVDVGRRFGSDRQFGVRLNAAYREGEGLFDDQDQSLAGVTLGLDYRLERVRLSADVVYQQRNTDAPHGLLFPGSVVPAVAAPKSTSNFFQPWTYSDSESITGMVRGEFDIAPNVTAFAAFGARDERAQSLQTNWSLQDGAGTIRATPFYIHSRYRFLSGETGLRGSFQTGSVRHDFTIAASMLRQELGDQSTQIQPAIFSNLYRPSALAMPALPSLPSIRTTNDIRLSSLALADTMSMFGDRVQVTVGVRRQSVRVDNFNATTGSPTSSYDESALSPMLGIVVRPWTNVSFYGNYIEGLTQGPIAPNSAVNAGEVFPPYKSRQYEVGVKVDFGRLAATISAFQIAQPSAFTDPVTMVYGIDGELRNRGVELNLFGEVAQGVRLLGGAAYTDSELTSTAGGANDGNAGVGVPKFQANLGAEWDVPFVPGLTLTARGLYTAPQYLNAANTQEIPDWVRLDVGARYSFEAAGTPITIRANIENLLDNDYWMSAARGGYKLGAPRTFLLSSTFSF